MATLGKSLKLIDPPRPDTLETTITVVIPGGGRKKVKRKFFGVRIGPFIVHQFTGKYPPGLLWQLTHEPSGFVVSTKAYYANYGIAYNIAKRLCNNRCWKQIRSDRSKLVPIAKAQFERVMETFKPLINGVQ